MAHLYVNKRANSQEKIEVIAFSTYVTYYYYHMLPKGNLIQALTTSFHSDVIAV